MMWATSAPSVTASEALVAVTEGVTFTVAKLKSRGSIVSCAVIPATVPLKVVESSCSVPLFVPAAPPVEPPLVISTVPPAIVVPLATPPDDIVSMPPLETVTLLMVVPATFKLPPLDTTILAALPHTRPNSDMAAYPNSNQRALMITIEAS
jgi:hypothetical protein